MRVAQKIRWALGAAAAAALVLSGCSAADPSGEGDGEVMELLRWAGPGPVVTIDGSVAGDFMSMNAILLTSGQLTRFDEDRVPQLDLAESVVLADDGLSATVTLLPDLEYSDGTPVLAEDLQYAYERNLTGTGAGFVGSIAAIEVVDERTAVIELKGVDPDLLSWLAERALQLHPKSLIESDADYWSHPVSAGPYVVEEGWVPGDPMFRATENPSYPHGPMAATTIEIISVPDSASRILQLQTGEIDAALDLPLSALAQTFPDEVSMVYAGTGGSNYLISNEALGGPFASPLVRQAMSLAVDRERISEFAFSGIQPASTSPMYDCGELCERNLLPNNGARDLDAAKALMVEAGYPDGFSADLKVSSGRGGWPEGAVVVAESLADIGITVTVTPVDEGQHFSSIGAGNYELFFAGGGGHYQSTLSQMLREGDFWVAATGWTPPARAAELLTISASSLDVEERRAAYTEAQEIWMEASHVIPLVERVQLNGSRVSSDVFVPQIKNDQKVIVKTLSR